MSHPPQFLTVADVLILHALQIDAHGGTLGIRDRGGLESAVAMPQAAFGGQFLHTDVFHMAAAYAFHIAESQAFLDGNKRTGLAAALVFLDRHGIGVDDPNQRCVDAMLAIAERRLDKAGLAALLRELAGAA